MASFECGGFLFFCNFDSGNLAKVEWVPRHESVVVPVQKHGKEVPDIPDIEFNIWTRPDCTGTAFENGNRTWFYFGVKGYLPCVLMKLNLVDLNRQAKMFSQGMAPVFKMVPGRAHWERIKDKPTYTVVDNIFTLSFKFKTPENIDTTMFFAFTYPYTYTELQNSLLSIDEKFLTINKHGSDDIYYVRECVCKSLEGRRVDLITISSYSNIMKERETRLKNLFPDEYVERPHKFENKKIIFISARVHPGETPSSFVFNGLLHFLLQKDDPQAIALRRLYVFKMIPFLNPDGVFRGHYRTDTRGVNLNRVYLNPTLTEHPSVYAARKLIQYYHNGVDKEADITERRSNLEGGENLKVAEQVQDLSLEERGSGSIKSKEDSNWKWQQKCLNCDQVFSNSDFNSYNSPKSFHLYCPSCVDSKKESDLFLYIDMHGHASKKGIFIYGNHFNDLENSVECMLLPKIMSLNNHNFHFTACNFTEKNMYLKDRRDGMSREGSGRVAVLKLTGLIKSYTLECNYNTGRLVNFLPPTMKEGMNKLQSITVPPKYTPHVFEEVGRAIGVSILDLTGDNPNSRIPHSEFHSLNGIREWLRLSCINEMGLNPRMLRNKMPSSLSYNQTSKSRNKKPMVGKARPVTVKLVNKKVSGKTGQIPIERKENMGIPSQTSCTLSASSSGSRIYNRPSSKGKGLALRRNTKKDSNQRSKNKFHPTVNPNLTNRSCQTSNTSINTLKNESSSSDSSGNTTLLKDGSKRIKVSSESLPHSTDRLKLREICLIKENRTKKFIAKFGSTESGSQDGEPDDDDDDLVVAWDCDYSPKVLSKYDRPASDQKLDRPYTPKMQQKFEKVENFKPATPEPSSSKHVIKPVFKSSFISVKAKRSKGSLRRFSASVHDSPGKIDKAKKRKKIKTKFL